MSPRDEIGDYAVAAALAATGDHAAATRRLSDKILSAFSHAYAVGEVDIARQLRAALAANEATYSVPREQRQGYNPLGQADLWVAFVEARNDFKRVRESAAGDADAVAVALDAMKDAYRRWSAG